MTHEKFRHSKNDQGNRNYHKFSIKIYELIKIILWQLDGQGFPMHLGETFERGNYPERPEEKIFLKGRKSKQLRKNPKALKNANKM